GAALYASGFGEGAFPSGIWISCSSGYPTGGATGPATDSATGPANSTG
ncbi:unnamed protein product, partial [marine sediment metagenome]